MNKFMILFSVALIPFISSCGFNESNDLPYIKERMQTDTIYKVSIGDCFEFKDNKIPGFGFVMREIILFSNNEIQYTITPVKLDTIAKGIDRFISGKTKIGKVIDNTSENENGIKLGLYGFSFFSKKEFNPIFKQFYKVGSMQISEKYNFIQSGTTEPDIKGILSHLEFWDTRFEQMYNEDVKNILEKSSR